MINKATLQLTFLIVISTNLPALEHTDKKRIIAVEILSFSFGGFLGYYGTQAGNGRYEIGLYSHGIENVQWYRRVLWTGSTTIGMGRLLQKKGY